MKNISPKHNKFVDEYFKDFNASRAYSVVYGIDNGDVAKANASRLLKKDTVAAEVNRRKSEISSASIKDKQKIIKDLTTVIDLFLTTGFHTGQALKAIELLTKMQGWNEPDKIEHYGNINLFVPGLEKDEEPNDEQ